MKTINNDIRIFIKDITLFLQNHGNYTPEKIEPMFQKAYKLYVKYDVENEQGVAPDNNPKLIVAICKKCGKGHSLHIAANRCCR